MKKILAFPYKPIQAHYRKVRKCKRRRRREEGRKRKKKKGRKKHPWSCPSEIPTLAF